jgi:hypothetical protein
MEILVIKFVVPRHYSLSTPDNQQLKLELPQGQLVFDISEIDATIYRCYTLKSNNLEFKITKETVSKIWDSLYLLCLEFDISILSNPDLISFYIPNQTIEEINKVSKINITPDFMGVQLVPFNTAFMGSGPVTLLAESDIKKFEELFNKYVNLNFKECDRIIRALEIYNSSNYLTGVNQSARFILLMSAIECLIEQDEVSTEAKFFIKNAQKEINNLQIQKSEMDSLRSSLGFLKRISIRQSGKKLVESLLNQEGKYNEYSPNDFFDKAYELRSRFVHDGLTKTDFLNMKTNELQRFTKDLLTNYFNKICC